MAMMHRIIVIGCPGAGKSTLAKALSAKLGIPLYHLDNIWFKADGEHITREEFDSKLSALLNEGEWIIDGNYQRTLERRLEAADTVLLYDIPTEDCIQGIEARVGIERSDIPFVSDGIDADFLTRVRSFSENELPHIYRLLSEIENKRVIVFRSREEAARFLSNI